MKFSRLLPMFAVVVGCVGLHADNEQKKEEEIRLIPFTSTAYWQDFILSGDSPVSDDGRYRLKRVRKNGDVELFLAQEREQPSIIVKPKPKKLKQGEPVPLIVVLESDPVKQSVKLSEMRLK